jgi:hypothetical protein
MRELRLLRKQVRALWKLEEDLPPNMRENHQWQCLAMQSGIPYLVGKGGANTFFYRIGEKDEMQYALPDDMFSIMDKWLAQDYMMYAITKKRDISNAPQSQSLDKLMKRTDDYYVGYYIVGITQNQSVVRLYTLKSGLRSNQWVPFKPKKKGK